MTLFRLDLAELVYSDNVLAQVCGFDAGVSTMVTLEVLGVLMHEAHVFRQVGHVFAAVVAYLTDAMVHRVLVLDEVAFEQCFVLALHAGEVLLLSVDISYMLIHIDYQFAALLAVFRSW